jgi:hypothetical protein
VCALLTTIGVDFMPEPGGLRLLGQGLTGVGSVAS